jgi:hypothetical protein
MTVIIDPATVRQQVKQTMLSLRWSMDPSARRDDKLCPRGATIFFANSDSSIFEVEIVNPGAQNLAYPGGGVSRTMYQGKDKWRQGNSLDVVQ